MEDQSAAKRKPTAAGVARAYEAIASVLPPTPLLPIEVDGATIWCKAEALQPVGAFKIRGAWWRLSSIEPARRAAGVVAFSSGNHAQGVAWAARRLGMPATIVMPRDAPEAKRRNTERLGAEIVAYDRATESREEIAATLAIERDAVLVPSFDDPWIVEGQGTCGVEARAQLVAATDRAPQRIVVCCGGGGLAAGVALSNPQAAITVVEPEGWDDMGRSLASGTIEPVGPNPPPTKCDALQTLRVSPLTFDILRERGATGAAVGEREVEAAMRVAFDRLRVVLEPGGAVALAAVLSGQVELFDGTVVTLSGGNVDAEHFSRVIGGSA